MNTRCTISLIAPRERRKREENQRSEAHEHSQRKEGVAIAVCAGDGISEAGLVVAAEDVAGDADLASGLEAVAVVSLQRLLVCQRGRV